MPEVKKIFLDRSVGEVLSLPDEAQLALVERAGAILAANGYKLAHATSAQGAEIENLYLKQSETGGGMATIRYNIAAADLEGRAIIILTDSLPETRTLSLAAYVREQGAADTANELNRKPAP